MRKNKKVKSKKRYNKFFSYINMDRRNRNFSYKDFSYSNSHNTRFTGSTFYGNYIYKATIKYCGFNGCSFSFVEFDNVNFRGSRFLGAKFENVVFRNCKLPNAKFTGATFKNVHFIGTGIKKSVSLLNNKSRQNDISEPIIIEYKLQETINQCLKNRYMNESKTLNKFSISRLLKVYSQDEVSEGLLLAMDAINKDFSNVSYYIPFIIKARKTHSIQYH